MKIKLLLPSSNGDYLLIQPMRTKVRFTIKCDNTGFSLLVNKWKLKELFMLSDSKTMKPIRKIKKIGMRFHK